MSQLGQRLPVDAVNGILNEKLSLEIIFAAHFKLKTFERLRTGGAKLVDKFRIAPESPSVGIEPSRPLLKRRRTGASRFVE